MIRDITIGQYYAADSIIHKLDPRVKLAGTMLYIISLFTADGPICYLLAVFALAAVIHLSTVPFKFMARGLKSIVIILLITVNLIFKCPIKKQKLLLIFQKVVLPMISIQFIKKFVRIVTKCLQVKSFLMNMEAYTN